MTELKTLEEINNKSSSQNKNLTKELRQEAIKWVKELEKKETEHWKKLDKHGYNCFPNTSDEDCWGYKIHDMRIDSHHEASGSYPIARFIKHFFNITEKNMKDVKK